MAAPLRAASNLTAATALIIGSVAGAALIVAGGVSAPILLNMSKDNVIEVVDLKDDYSLTYGQALDLSGVTIKVGNQLSSEIKNISGDKATVEGFDKESISNKQEVTLSYLEWTKKISVTVNPKKLGVPTITFDKNTGVLSWEPVEEASKYKLNLTEPDTERFITEYTTEETRYDFNSVQFYSQFNVAVTAMNDKKGSNGVSTYVDGDPSAKSSLRKIPEVTHLQYDIDAGKFIWDEIDGITEYEVRVNDSIHRPTTNELPYNTTNPGIYNVSIRGIGPAGTYATPVAAEFRRLPTPVLNFVDGAIQAENAEAGIQYYRDGEPFSGNANDIKVAGNYQITAKNISQSEFEIDSALSTAITLRKLDAPTLDIVGGELVVTGKSDDNSVQYYLDGEPFTGELFRITEPGNHKIVAKVIGNSNQIDSELSNEIIVRKLEAPVVSFDGSTFTFSNMDEGFKYQIDNGEPRDDLIDPTDHTLSNTVINGLTAGEHTIRAKNRGNGNDILASVDSNVVRFLIPDVSINDGTATDQESGQKMFRISATHEMQGIGSFEASCTIEWWMNGDAEPIDTSPQKLTVFYASQQATPLTNWFRRGSKIADYVRYQVSLDIDFGTVQVLKQTYDWRTIYN